MLSMKKVFDRRHFKLLEIYSLVTTTTSHLDTVGCTKWVFISVPLLLTKFLASYHIHYNIRTANITSLLFSLGLDLS